LEVYILLSKDFPVHTLQGLQNVSEVTAGTGDGERVLRITKDLKKD
jgi:hypothetical protein